MREIDRLDCLAFEFFKEFARCEYCLKAVGFRVPSRRDPQADWGAFSQEVQGVFERPPTEEFSHAIRYYREFPPRKQVLRNGLLDWAEVAPDHECEAELILRLVCRVRNNLFHGGKFNGHWFAPERSDELLRWGLCILRVVVEAHPRVREAYAHKAS